MIEYRAVSGLSIGPLVLVFCSSLADPMFRDLFCSQLTNVPIILFLHIRTSTQKLISPPLQDTTHSYPHYCMVPNLEVPMEASVQWVLSLIQWDPHWGYTHWHQFIHDFSSFHECPFHFIAVCSPYLMAGHVVLQPNNTQYRHPRTVYS